MDLKSFFIKYKFVNPILEDRYSWQRWNRSGRDRNFTGWKFWEIFFVNPIFDNKKQDFMFFCQNAQKKWSKYSIWILRSEVLFEKIQYNECVSHVFVKYFICGAIFCKSFLFQKFQHCFAGISPVGHAIPIDRFTGRTGPVYHFSTGSSADGDEPFCGSTSLIGSYGWAKYELDRRVPLGNLPS